MARAHEIMVFVRTVPDAGMPIAHRVDGWTGWHVESSMIKPADSFELRRPFDLEHWRLFRRDAQITIHIDGAIVMDGFVDKRVRSAKAGTMTISGRDRVGRLVDESAPAIHYDGITILAAIAKLAEPWFRTVTVTDARNRHVRRGKGKRVASGSEPSFEISIRKPRHGVVHPGMSRWNVIHEIASRAGLIAYSSADGVELFIGKPNHNQDAQYTFSHAAPGSGAGYASNLKELTITEDDTDRYSLIMTAGTGGQGDTNYGKNVTDHRGVVFDNPQNRFDGTGLDFVRPKRLFMPERQFSSLGDAQRVARNEQLRRDFKRHTISIEAPMFGQFDEAGEVTLFAPNTVAVVRDEEMELFATYLIYECSFSAQRGQGDSTTLHLVPTGTEFIQ